MSIIQIAIENWQFNRDRTLATINSLAETDDPMAVLGWRPGPGRAHIAWQLMHIGITEERFAMIRPIEQSTISADLIERFRGGSVPDDNIPTIEEIRNVLEESRRHLLATMDQLTDDDLATVPERFQERGWDLRTCLKVLTWHEPHHQGQAHITFNLWKASR